MFGFLVAAMIVSPVLIWWFVEIWNRVAGQRITRSFSSDFATALETSVMKACAEEGSKVLLTPDQSSLFCSSE